MGQLREYVISLAAAAIIVGIVTGLTGKKDTAGTLLRLVAGLFLAFTVVRPVVELEIGDLGTYVTSFSREGQLAVSAGEDLAADAVRAYIKSHTESYILDKAEGYGASLSADVTLGADDLPVSVRLAGRISPYGKLRLQELLETELGIGREDQIWIG